MIAKVRSFIREGKERRKGVNILHLINTALLGAIFLFVQNDEHRMTALETKVDILMRASGIEIPDYLKQREDKPNDTKSQR